MVTDDGDRGATSLAEKVVYDTSRPTSDIDYHTPHVSNDVSSTHDRSAPTLADGRSDKATDFYPEEGADVTALTRQRKWNDGQGASSRREDNRWANIRRDITMVADTLSLPPAVENGAIQYLRRTRDDDQYDNGLRSVGRGRIESVVCGAIKLAAATNHIALVSDDFAPICEAWRVEYDAVRSAHDDLRPLTREEG